MNIKMIITLICLIYCIAPTYQIPYNELVKFLDPASVTDWYKMKTDPDPLRLSMIMMELLHFGFSREIATDFMDNSIMQNLPAGLVSHYLKKNRRNDDDDDDDDDDNDDNSEDDNILYKYNCKRVPGDREAVLVLYSHNTTMPDDMKANPGFIVLFDKGGVNQAPFTYNVEINANDLELAKRLLTARVNWNRVLYEPTPTRLIKVKEELINLRFSSEIVEILLHNSKKEHWPAGLLSCVNNTIIFSNCPLDRYKLRHIPGEQEAVIVFYFDNPRMSEEMKANPGFLVLFYDGAVEQSPFTCDVEINAHDLKLANRLQPARVNWNRVLYEPTPTLLIKVKEELNKLRFTPEIVEILLHNSKKEHWPAGLISCVNNTVIFSNCPLDRYKLRHIPGEQEAVIVFYFDNPRMSEEMKANPGFLVLFYDGAVEVI